jgi:ribosome-associated toxin RatA of RatAB toxin-antitoxin module
MMLPTLKLNQRLISSSLVCSSLAIVTPALAAAANYPEARTASHRPVFRSESSAIAVQPFHIAQAGVSVTGSEGNFTGQVLVRTSVQTAWSVLTDYNGFSSFVPSIAESRVLQSNGNRKVFEQVNVIRVFPFTRRSRVVISSVESYPQQIAFSLVEGDIESLQGVWRIQPRGDNQVLITHQVAIDPGSSPMRGLFFNIYKSTLASTLAALKQEMERRSS